MTQPPSSSENILNATTILLFSDDPVSARFLKQVLLHCKHRVRQVRTVAMLRSAIAQKPPEMILFDLVSPDEDIFTLCKELKSIPPTLFTPIIFVSPFQQVTDKVRAFEVGGADYLTKPFHPA